MISFMFTPLRLLVVGTLFVSLPSLAVGNECALRPAFNVGTTGTVFADPDSSLFFRSKIAIDLDGAPNAYHRNGTPVGALDTLCNAGKSFPGDGRAPYSPDNARCGEFLTDVKTAEADNWIGKTKIEWFGLATLDPRRNIPFVQTTGPTKGYFISVTALQDTSFAADNPSRYLDSTVIPYFVLPKRSAFFTKYEVSLGDVVASINLRTGRIALGVVGDIGPYDKLGEASYAYAVKLKSNAMPSVPSTSKIAKSAAIEESIATAVIPRSRVSRPYTRDGISVHTSEEFAKWGGKAKLVACGSMLQRK